MALGLPFGCGQCLPCRVNRKRLWSHRILLESLLHAHSCFVTLTYSPEKLPEGGTLVPRHMQLFFKRLRNLIRPKRIRYYMVGEYGERSGRPHYHVCLFGLGIEDSEVLAKAWIDPDDGLSIGLIHVGTLTLESAAYCASYVTKGMTKGVDHRLHDRFPEFCRMSNRPGIAADAMPYIAEELTSQYGSLIVAQKGDVPTSVNMGRSSMPLGRYLRRKLRVLIGLPEDHRSPEFQQWVQEMQSLFVSEAVISPVTGKAVQTAASKKSVVLRYNEGKLNRLEARHRISMSKVKTI